MLFVFLCAGNGLGRTRPFGKCASIIPLEITVSVISATPVSSVHLLLGAFCFSLCGKWGYYPLKDNSKKQRKSRQGLVSKSALFYKIQSSVGAVASSKMSVTSFAGSLSRSVATTAASILAAKPGIIS